VAQRKFMAQINTPQPIRGMQSLLGEEADRFHAVVSAFDRVRRLFGFKRVEVPVLEPTAVFARSLGETTDVVSKEMYTFEDRSGDSVTLRPEFTAGIARAFLTEGWQQFAPLKVATHGPAFRYERPQKGRFRQFHQLDAEILGAAEPQADVEVLCFAATLLQELKIEGVTLQLNTLGDSETRSAWRDALVDYFQQYEDALSDESLARLERNPLRILDSKHPGDIAIASGAPSISEFMSDAAGHHFTEVVLGLHAAEVDFVRNHKLVRGLDYYRHTAFEFVTDRLGSQSTVLAGGRYDGLIEALGGPHTPAIGWAAGIERLSMLIDKPPAEAVSLAIVVESKELADLGVELAQLARGVRIACELLASGNVRKRYDKALKSGASAALIINDYGLEPGALANIRLKDLPGTGRFDHVHLTKLAEALQGRFGVKGLSYAFMNYHEVALRRLPD
jgi:histidyl-tRNA synthetase